MDTISGVGYDGSANPPIRAAVFTVLGNAKVSYDNSVPSLSATVTSAIGNIAEWEIPNVNYLHNTLSITFVVNGQITPYQAVSVGFWDGPPAQRMVDLGPQNGVAFELIGNPYNSRAYVWVNGIPTYSNTFNSDVTNSHTYKIVWTSGQAQFYIDGILQYTGVADPNVGGNLRLNLSNSDWPAIMNPVTVTFTLGNVSP